MRLIGTLPDTAQARRFVAYLHTVGIDAVDEGAPTGRQVWVREEDAVERAKTEFEAFRDDPAAAKFLAAEKQSRDIARAEQEERAKRRDRVVTGKDLWKNASGPPSRRLPVTWSLIGASVVCTALIWFGNPNSEWGNWALEKGQFASEQDLDAYLKQASLQGEEIDGLPLRVVFGAILRGEVWRLVTPIFLHFGPIHLIFNMLWLHQLGGQMENRLRAWRYALLILLFAVAGNVAQAAAPLDMGGSPLGGGMSGVVYGCFGYVWMKTLIDPRAGYRISTFAVFLLIGWHVLTSMPGNEMFGGMVANVGAWAHGGGLVAGMLAAGAAYLLKRSRA